LKCNYCGKDEALPFRCQYCHGSFCPEHRLPENHNCPEIDRAIAARAQTQGYEYKVTFTPTAPKAKFSFSPTEIKHLIIGALLVSGVGLSWMISADLSNFSFALPKIPSVVLVGLVVLFTAAFFLHEIAHKLAAQHFGLWAEFRLILIGAVITLLSIISPFKFIAPGAVMIAGSDDENVVGKTSIAGPLTNIVFGFVAFAFAFVLPPPFILLAVYPAFFNATISVLNLIPLGILDGYKIFKWNKVMWAFAFVPALALGVLVVVLYGPYLGF
jgi:Zn-dependent protease